MPGRPTLGGVPRAVRDQLRPPPRSVAHLYRFSLYRARVACRSVSAAVLVAGLLVGGVARNPGMAGIGWVFGAWAGMYVLVNLSKRDDWPRVPLWHAVRCPSCGSPFRVVFWWTHWWFGAPASERPVRPEAAGTSGEGVVTGPPRQRRTAQVCTLACDRCRTRYDVLGDDPSGELQRGDRTDPLATASKPIAS